MSQAIALSPKEIEMQLSSQLPEWALVDGGLQRSIEAQNYLEALNWLYEIGKWAEKQDHHPDLLLHYKRLTVRYWTHTVNGITQLDVENACGVQAYLQDGKF